MNPPIIVTLLTYKRTDYALKIIPSITRHLKYDGEILWYIADGGSPEAHVSSVEQCILENGGKIAGKHTGNYSPGKNWNLSIENSFKISPLYFRLEDDWELMKDFDLSAYAKLLMENDSIGMIRCGYISDGLVCHTTGRNGIIYLKIGKENNYCFAGHPALMHFRFNNSYGYFREGIMPGDTEVEFNWRVRQTTSGPEIFYPIDIAPSGPFAHIGTIKSEEL